MLVEASRFADRVVFVDSASTDCSVQIARDRGVPVVEAPLGKGRAVSRLFDELDGEHACLIDADIVGHQDNFAELICRESGHFPEAMIVGQFWGDGPRLMPSTDGVYGPLSESFFPEIGDRFGSKPLTGFRVIPPALQDLDLPHGFGLESFFNIESVMTGIGSRVVDIGRYIGRFKAKPEMPVEIGRTILDLAVSHHRLDPANRASWETWLENFAGPLRNHRVTAGEYIEMRNHVLSHLESARPPGAFNEPSVQ